MIYNYKGLVIKNLDAMPRRLGAKYLEVLEAHNGDLVAYKWRRNLNNYGAMPDDHKIVVL